MSINCHRLLSKEQLNALLNNIDNILLDCDGVLWRGVGGKEVINNANVAVNKLVDLGKKIYLVTNNSTRTQKELAKHASSLGFNCDETRMISAPFIMGEYLKSLNFNKKIYVIGSEGLSGELEEANIECIWSTNEFIEGNIYESVQKNKISIDPEVGAVAVGFDRYFNYDKLVKGSVYLSNPNCLFLGSNIDIRYPVGGTNCYLPAGGVMVKALEASTGRSAIIVGKPSKLMFEVLASKHNLNASRTLMVGDTLHTDIAFGNECNMKTLLVLSGVSKIEEVECLAKENPSSNLIPDYYIDSLGDVINMFSV